MNVAPSRPLSAADLNFNPARLPLGRLAYFAREHWGVEGEFTPLDGERDQNHRLTTADGAKYVLSPPLRPKDTQDRLWRGLAFNDLQAISTDHCPFCMKEQKTMGEGDFSKIPNGAPGIETRMSLVYDGGVRTGRISLNRFVELTSTSPAKIFGLFPRKGTIAPGSDADIVIFDPAKTMRLGVKTLHMKVDYNPYEGREVTGVTDTVISRGRVIIDAGRFTGRAGAGSFLARNPRP